jgi:hypothetical protein
MLLQREVYAPSLVLISILLCECTNGRVYCIGINRRFTALWTEWREDGRYTQLALLLVAAGVGLQAGCLQTRAKHLANTCTSRKFIHAMHMVNIFLANTDIVTFQLAYMYL